MSDNDSVTQRQFFETMNATTDKIVGKIDGVKVDITDLKREVGEIKTTTKANADNIKKNCDHIEEIQKQQKGFAAIASAIGGAIGIVTAAVLKFVVGE